MDIIQIEDEQLVKRLQKLSKHENKSVEAILKRLLDQYMSRKEAFHMMAGMFDDDIPDLSTSVRDFVNR